MKKVPELVAPGWSYNKAMVAWHYGADAVYLGVPFTSLRMRQNKVSDFGMMKKTIQDLHSIWKRALLTMNIFARNHDIKIFEKIVEKISDSNPDAIIFWDPGTYKTLKKYLPNVPLHLSTQTNVLNYESVRFWQDLWVKRIVLARELWIREIEQIKKNVPDMEIEIFIHWSMCVAYSWRCLLWEYFSWREWNKWECSHVCRYKFKVKLNEEKRPWKDFDLIQNEEWTHILSSKDLCTIDRLDEICDIVDAVKIEWRSKWEFYLWATVGAYRHTLDCISNWTNPNFEIQNLVNIIPHRPYWSGFLFNDLHKNYPDWIDDNSNDWQKEISIGFGSWWPVVEKEYFWLVLPQIIDIDIDWKKNQIYKFIPKQTIKKWQKIEFFGKNNIWKICILWFWDSNWKELDYVDCNTKWDIFIKTDVILNWFELLYSDPVNFNKN